MHSAENRNQEQIKKSSSSRLVPWEPYKAATSANVKSMAPSTLPPLIPYQISSMQGCIGSLNTSLSNGVHFIDSSDGTEQIGTHSEESVISDNTINGDTNLRNGSDSITSSVNATSQSCEIEVRRLKAELEMEKQVSAELKRLLVASMGDDLMCHVKSLSEDKIRLASTMNSFAAQLSVDHDRAENLAISSDVWRCKFLAMSIRADELRSQREHLLALLKDHHSALSDLYDAIRMPSSPSSSHFNPNSRFPNSEITTVRSEVQIPGAVLDKVQQALATDISSVCERTPCDEKVKKGSPVTSNITVSCCKHCAGREIKLL